MIWYRHWLEVRWILPPMAIAIVLITAPYGIFSLGGDPVPSRQFAREMLATPLGRTLGDAELRVWALFAERIWAAIFLAGFGMTGNGLRSLGQLGYHASAYTLTLPVSRTRLMATRLIVGAAGVVAAVMLLSAAHALVPAMRGESVPIGPMIESFALSIPAAVAWAAVMQACITFVRPFWVFLLAALLGIAAFLPVRHLVSAPAYGVVPWAVLGGFVLLTVIAVAVTLRKGTTLEIE